jgi:hypothetical protein
MVFLSFKGEEEKNQRNHYEKRKNFGFLEETKYRYGCQTRGVLVSKNRENLEHFTLMLSFGASLT